MYRLTCVAGRQDVCCDGRCHKCRPTLNGVSRISLYYEVTRGKYLFSNESCFTWSSTDLTILLFYINTKCLFCSVFYLNHTFISGKRNIISGKRNIKCTFLAFKTRTCGVRLSKPWKSVCTLHTSISEMHW